MRAVWGQRESVGLAGVSFGFAGVLGLWLIFTLFFVPFQAFPRLPKGQKLNTIDSEGKEGYKERVNKKPRIDIKLFFSEGKIQIVGFLKYALTFPFLIFCFVPLCAFIRNAYYQTSFKKHLPNARDFFVILNPLSFIPCPLLGIFADKISTAFAISVIAFCGAISMLLVMFNSVVLQYVSVLFNFVFTSYIASEVSPTPNSILLSSFRLS